MRACWLIHRVGQKPEPYIYRYIRCTYGLFSKEITIHTVIYGADIRLWPTLHNSDNESTRETLRKLWDA